MTKRGMVRPPARRGRYPDLISVEQFVFEVLIEKSHFPELIGDVFADIGDRTIRADDDLVVFMAFGVQSHDPATGVLPFLLQEDGFPFTELPKRVVPEFQMQDVALTREQIVSDVDALHGAQMAPNDCHSDNLSHM